MFTDLTPGLSSDLPVLRFIRSHRRGRRDKGSENEVSACSFHAPSLCSFASHRNFLATKGPGLATNRQRRVPNG